MGGDVRALLAHACADLAQTMARPDAGDVVLDDVAGHVARILGVGMAGVVLGGPDAPLEVAAATDDVVVALVDVGEAAGDGPCTEATARGAVSRVDTLIDLGDRWPQWAREARAHGVGAWLTVPSRFEESTVVLAAGSTRPRHWEDAEVAAVQVLADLAAGCVARETELGRVRRTADQLQQALDRRLVIEQAKGILAGELHCSLDQAFALLRDHARRNNVTVRSLAHAVVHLGLRPPRNLGGKARGAAEVPWTR
jgi:GAF domain-containing protein